MFLRINTTTLEGKNYQNNQEFLKETVLKAQLQSTPFERSVGVLMRDVFFMNFR